MIQAPAKKIRVLVVDDSAFMRKAISIMMSDDPAIEVVGTARDGQEGLEKVLQLTPDLVTMDIEMPRMDGLAALRKIMAERPTPVMMVSSLTTDGAQATLDALELGAVDFIPKQLSYVSLDIVKIKQELLEKIKHIHARKHLLMARYRSHRVQTESAKTLPAAPRKRPDSATTPVRLQLPVNSSKFPKKTIHVVAIGTSTGGPPALQTVIPSLPENFPVPVLVVQHMPPTFTQSLANRLNGLSAVQVKEAEHGEKAERGIVYISPGDRHMTIVHQSGDFQIRLSVEPSASLYRPSVDVMMNSVAASCGSASMGVIMTGMGHDGLDGLKLLKEKGGVVVAQNEESCIVYGMPRAVIEAGIADKISSLERIAFDIVNYF